MILDDMLMTDLLKITDVATEFGQAFGQASEQASVRWTFVGYKTLELDLLEVKFHQYRHKEGYPGFPEILKVLTFNLQSSIEEGWQVNGYGIDGDGGNHYRSAEDEIAMDNALELFEGALKRAGL